MHCTSFSIMDNFVCIFAVQTLTWQGHSRSNIPTTMRPCPPIHRRLVESVPNFYTFVPFLIFCTNYCPHADQAICYSAPYTVTSNISVFVLLVPRAIAPSIVQRQYSSCISSLPPIPKINHLSLTRSHQSHCSVVQ